MATSAELQTALDALTADQLNASTSALTAATAALDADNLPTP